MARFERGKPLWLNGFDFFLPETKKNLGKTTKTYYLATSEIVYVATPYSMNSLFSEFFRKFGGVFLEVCETSSGGIWEVLGGNM